MVAVDGGSTSDRRSDVVTHVHAFADGSLFVSGGSTRTDSNPVERSSLSHRPFVFKLGPDGEFDPSFGLIPHIHFPCSVPCSSDVRDVIVDADGRIELAGSNCDITSKASVFAATRTRTNGMPGPTFDAAAPVRSKSNSRWSTPPVPVNVR